MKVLMFITGRGIGGDSMTAFNVSKVLENKGVKCDFVLDPTAPGLLFKNHNKKWYKSPIPQAGGTAATKITLIKAAFKSLNAIIKGMRLIKKVNPDVVVGVFGGGVVISSVASKLLRKNAVSIVATPTDTRISKKLNETIILPESDQFIPEISEVSTSGHKIYKEFSPINPNIVNGNKENGLKQLPKEFDPSRPTILFSSGSTLFEGMAKAVCNLAKTGINANLLVVGTPLEEEYFKYLSHPNIINLGYIAWIKDLYKVLDLAVITDDGLTLHEIIACTIPVVVVIGVKYGRYHNLSSVFKGAVLESSEETIGDVVEEALENEKLMKNCAKKYSEDILNAGENISEIILNNLIKSK